MEPVKALEIFHNNDTSSSEVTNKMLPSERIGKGMWLWLSVSAPIMWMIHGIILGLGFILGDHFSFPVYLTVIIYGWLCIQSTSDVYNSISIFTHNRNTLLGYLYALGLSVGNVGFWMLASESSFAPFVMLLMIVVGLMTGRWTELQMRQRVYSEAQQTYLTKSNGRTFPIEHVHTVLKLVEQGDLSSLKTLPARYEENCCRVRLRYSTSSSDAIVNVETEEEHEYSIAGFTFILPITHNRVVSSMHINLEDHCIPTLDSDSKNALGPG